MPNEAKIYTPTYDKRAGEWKFQLKVPPDLWGVVGKRSWEKRLGPDRDAALIAAQPLHQHYKAEIARLRDPVQHEAALQAGVVQAATAILETAPSPVVDRLAASYHLSQVERNIERFYGESDDEYAERLRLILAVTFGDTTGIDRHPLTDPHRRAILKRLGVGAAAPKPKDQRAFNAWHNETKQALSELRPAARTDSENTLPRLLDRLAALDSLSPNTVRAYRRGIARLIQHTGDLDVREYTSAMLREHRDRLAADGIEATSIRTMFAGIGSVLSYALNEGLIEAQPLAGMKYPRDKKTVEERRYLPFSPSNAAKVWEAAHERFGSNSGTKLSPERRLAYLWAVKTMMLTGMRPHEFFRLRNKDVADVSTFDNYDGDWKGVAIDIWFSKIGNRMIPLPNMLGGLDEFIQSGGLDCVRNVEGIEANFSDKQFTPMLKELGLKRPRVSLYSTRSTLNMALKNLGAEEPLRQQIIGHKPTNGMMRHYTDPETMNAMSEALNKVRFW